MVVKKIIVLTLMSSIMWGLGLKVPKIIIKEVPIIEAIKAGKYNRFKKLFDKSKIQKRYSQNQTLLHYASRYNKQKIAHLLVQKGSLLNAKGGEYNSTPLHMAIRYGYLELAVYLIKYHTPLNIVDKDGETALDISRRLGYTNISELLIAYGAKSKENNEETSTEDDGVNKYKKGSRVVNKYKNSTTVNSYQYKIKGNKVELRHIKFESESNNKNNDKSLGETNSKIEIGQ